MSTNWTLYETRLKLNGNNIRERQIELAQNAILKAFEDSPSYRLTYINSSTTGTPIQVLEEKDSDIKTILMQPNDEINVGDIFEFDSEKWICKEVTKTNPVEQSGKVQQCNNVLKFYNKIGLSFTLANVPCIVSSPFKTNMGMDNGSKYISTETTDYQITLPFNNDTKSISIGMRFLLNGRAFVCEGYDDLSVVGLKNIKVVMCDIVPDDNIELGVANYFSHQPEPTPTNETIIITPSDSTIDRNSTKVFTSSVFINDVENTTERTIWIITNKDGTTTPYCLMTYDNRTCTLVASNVSSAVGKVINLRIVLESNENIYVDKEIVVTSLI